MPLHYVSEKFTFHNVYGVANPYRDHWCFGIILLEILAGSELVLGIRCHEDLRSLFYAVANYLDEDTRHVLQHLLFMKKDVDLEAYVGETLDRKKEHVAQGIRRINAAIEESAKLQRFLTAARSYLSEHDDAIYKMHKAKKF
jgi:hypothetical protein